MFLSRLFTINKEPSIKVYHGYGDEDGILILGHVLKRSPFPPKSYKKNVWSNTKALIKYFLTAPYEGAEVSLTLGGETIKTITDEHGFFRIEWKARAALQTGWNRVVLSAITPDGDYVSDEGKILFPSDTQYAFISDIDDTFLVSHSSNLPKRLYALFTKNPQTRKPFKDVVAHYNLLAKSAKQGKAPFFYVSSSEWNLYEYIKEFCRFHDLPEGVFLLSTLKRWHELFKTGQGKHGTKLIRISHVIKAFPHRKYVLLGDDTQKDPEIYLEAIEQFPDNISCVYIRRIEKDHYQKTERIISSIRDKGIEAFYYKHSSEAIAHSKEHGYIDSSM